MISKHILSLALGAFLVPSLAATVLAAEPRALPQLASHVTDLGNNTTALIYWVAQADGVHVTTTVDTMLDDEPGAAPDRHSIVRFSALIAPGQSQVISVMRPAGSAPLELHIRRLGGGIEVARSGNWDQTAIN